MSAATVARPAGRRRATRRPRSRAWVVGVALALVTVAGLVLSVTEGELGLSPLEVVRALIGAGDASTTFVVVDLRLPRALTAVLVGLAFGMSGAIFQELSRNALASPDVVGVTAGAGVAGVAIIVLGGSAVLVPAGALAGGLVTAAALYVLAWREGLQGPRLVLVGVGLTAMLGAATSYLLTRGEITEVQQATVWLVGSVYARGWEHVVPLALALVVLLPAALATTRWLAALQLGDDVAVTLGVRAQQARAVLVLVAVALAAFAVAAAGPVAFVAFIAPHLARRLVPGAGPAVLLPCSGLAGAAVVVLADLLARTAFAPVELPVGIVTAILAAPYFLLLLRRANRLGVSG